jgi:hypothetical protein
MTRVRTAMIIGLFLVSGCGTAHAGHGGGEIDSAKPMTLEQLAAKTGCANPETQGKTSDMRQGVCRNPQGQYTVTTFVTDKGQREWLDYAQAYGGTYLIGPRWIIVGTPSVVESFHETLGGKLETMEHHT